MPVAVLLLTGWLQGHVVGLSQGDVVVDTGDGRGDVVVDVDVVFARADAARLAAPALVVRTDDGACAVLAEGGDDVEGDGRALRLQARCGVDDGAVVVDVAGLAALPSTHRMALRITGPDGTRAALLRADDHGVVVRAAPDAHAGRWHLSWSLVVDAVAALAVCFGARTRGALARTVVLGVAGALAAVVVSLVAPPGAGDASLVPPGALEAVVAALAVAGVVVDPAPRPRGAAFALGALLALRVVRVLRVLHG